MCGKNAILLKEEPMSVRKVACGLAALWAIICVPAFGEDALPLVEHAGTIGAPELIVVFNDICLENFANFSVIEAAFSKQGFDVTPRHLDRPGQSWKIRADRRGISGRFGFHKVSDGYNYNACLVEAYVNDPDAIDRKTLASDLAGGAPLRHNSSIPRWESGYETIFTKCASDGSEAEVSLEWPGIWEIKPSGQSTSQLERKKFTLSISRKLDYNGFDISRALAGAERTPC